MGLYTPYLEQWEKSYKDYQTSTRDDVLARWKSLLYVSDQLVQVAEQSEDPEIQARLEYARADIARLKISPRGMGMYLGALMAPFIERMWMKNPRMTLLLYT